MFNCGKCEKKLWTSYNKLPDGIVVCNNCYSLFLTQNLDKIIDSKAYAIVYNFVEKYQGKYPSDLLKELIRLLEIKYNISIDIITLSGILKIIKNKIEKEDNLKRLAKFEKELIKDNTTEEIQKNQDHLCEICNIKLPKSEFDYSMTNYGKPLCLTHQREKRASPHAQKLYEALKSRGVFCELESYDGNKHVDISIRDAKLYIGVDGEHHSLDPIQLHLDLVKDGESYKQGFATKRYTIREIDDNLEVIADVMTEVIKQRRKEIQEEEIIVTKSTGQKLSTSLKKGDKK